METEKRESSSNLEKGEHVVVQTNPQYACLIYWSSHLLSLWSRRYHFDVHDLDHVQRRLKQRHVQM
jgi:amino acid transporter